MNSRALGLIAFLVVCVPVFAADDALPPIHINRAGGPIVVDGDLSDAGWQGATKFESWYETNPGDNIEPKVKQLGYVAYDEHFLYVAMTARDQVFRIAYQGGSLGAIGLFKQGTNGGALDGADGIAFDVEGNLYVCSNQSDEVAVLSPGGAVIAEYRGTGANAFNSPASLVFRGKQVYVSDLALFHGGPQKLSTFKAPNRGAPLVPSARDGNSNGNDEDEQGDDD